MWCVGEFHSFPQFYVRLLNLLTYHLGELKVWLYVLPSTLGQVKLMFLFTYLVSDVHLNITDGANHTPGSRLSFLSARPVITFHRALTPGSLRECTMAEAGLATSRLLFWHYDQYTAYGQYTVTLEPELSDPQPGFQGHCILRSRIFFKTVHFRDKVTKEH